MESGPLPLSPLSFSPSLSLGINTLFFSAVVLFPDANLSFGINA